MLGKDRSRAGLYIAVPHWYICLAAVKVTAPFSAYGTYPETRIHGPEISIPSGLVCVSKLIPKNIGYNHWDTLRHRTTVPD